MVGFLIVLQVIFCVGLVALVLLQKSEGGGLGIGGGGMSNFVTGRAAANFLTRMTAYLAGGFMVCSVLITLLVSMDHPSEKKSLLDQVEPSKAEESTLPQGPQPPAPTAPAAPVVPSVPSAPTVPGPTKP